MLVNVSMLAYCAGSIHPRTCIHGHFMRDHILRENFGLQILPSSKKFWVSKSFQ